MSQRERYERGGIGRWYWDYRDRTILSMIGEGPTLDAGCGDGITAEKIGAVGMDLDRGDVRGSVYDIPFKKGAYGTVVFSEVVEHLAEPEAAMGEINRILKNSGRLIMVFPNDLVFKIARFICGMWGEMFRDCGHLRQWTPRDAAETLRRQGFKVIARRSIPFNFWPMSLHHIVVGEKC